MSEPGVRFTPASLARQLAASVIERTPSGPLRVLDPACGDGALLLAAWEVAQSRRRRVLELHGFESDGERAALARARLEAALGRARTTLRIRSANALADETAWPADALVLANPPWVSYSGRQAAPRPAGFDELRRRFPSLAGWPSLHGAFLERIAEHVHSSRRAAGVLMPASVCELAGYATLRERATELAELLEAPLDLGESSFRDVCEPAVRLTLGPRRRAGCGSRAPWARAPRPDPLVDRLAAFPPLPPECYGDPGVHTGNAARELVRRDQAGAQGAGLAELREGRDLRAYRLGEPRAQLDLRVPRSGERRFRIGSIERYRAVPVLLRQTSDRPVAALHSNPTYFRNTLLACTPPLELDPAFVVAVLNSPLLARFHHARHRDARQRSFPQVKVAHLRALPFPIRARADASHAHDRIARQVRALDADEIAADTRAGIVAEIEARVADLFGVPHDACAPREGAQESAAGSARSN